MFELLTEETRDWSPTEMVEEFDRRGIQVYQPGSKDRTKNVRFQLADFAKPEVGKAIRVEEGRYRAVEWQPSPRQSLLSEFDAESPALNGAGSVHVEDGG